MGNSGSLNSLSGFDEHYHQSQHILHQQQLQQQRYQEHHNSPPASWLQSYPREPPNIQNQQIKVLPDIPGKITKLRSTNNGNILHAGGTISKNNNLQRSKSISSPNYQQHQQQSPDENNLKLLPSRMVMTRSRTQMNLISRHSDNVQTSYISKKAPAADNSPALSSKKRFGSEPDLRVSPSTTETSEENSQTFQGNSKPASQSKILKGKNKKKAPVVPQEKIPKPEPEKQRIVAYSPLRKTNSDASSTLPSSSNEGPPTRKLRLFKTRAESKKNTNITKLPEASDAKYNAKKVEPAPKPKNLIRKENELDKVTEKSLKKPNPTSFFRREKTFDIGILTERNKMAENVPKIKPTMSPPIVHRKAMLKPLTSTDKSRPSKPDVSRKQSQPPPQTMTDFQKELKLATRRKSIAACNEINKRKAPEIKVETKKLPVVVEKKKDKTPPPPQQPPSPKLQPAPKTSFYFGMPDKSNAEIEKPMVLVEAKIVETKDDSEDEMMDKNQLDVIDKFAASLLNGKKFNSTDSIASSDMDDRMQSTQSYHVDDDDGHEISLKLRPTLPRKQFEIPRFSPAAAWRLLTTEDDFGKESTDWIHYIEKKTEVRNVEGAENNSEERIERIYREPVPGLQDNKSGDSGISGDAGLPDIPEPQLLVPKSNASPETSPNNWSANKIHLTPWTPQQDLEDDDDATGSSDENENPQIETDFSGKGGHLFSLSLPRENHLSIYSSNHQDKAEKHVFNSLQKLRKTVVDVFNIETNDEDGVTPIESNDNWFLSRLDSNSYEKRQLSPAQQKSLDNTKDHHASIGYLVSGKHLMYLPKDVTKISNSESLKSVKNDQNNNDVLLKKNIEDKENLQDPLAMDEIDFDNFPVKLSRSRHHRFTFQSTIRQIEKRRIADKLSKEAEVKEAHRLSELEAMRQVEEEFQRKRAREKASIRHQLRLFSLEENQPFDVQNEGEPIQNDQERSDPDGDSSTAHTSLPYQTSKGIYRKNTVESDKLPRRMKQTFNSKEYKKYANNFDSDDDDEDEPDEISSSIGYIDTRTPYISRIIQQKSSKSNAGLVNKIK